MSKLDWPHHMQHVHAPVHFARLSTLTARIVRRLVQVFRVQCPSTLPSMATCGDFTRSTRCSRLSQRRGCIANDAIQSLGQVLVLLISQRGACMQYMLATSNSSNTCGADCLMAVKGEARVVPTRNPRHERAKAECFKIRHNLNARGLPTMCRGRPKA